MLEGMSEWVWDQKKEMKGCNLENQDDELVTVDLWTSDMASKESVGAAI